jgi:hypothetical protein
MEQRLERLRLEKQRREDQRRRQEQHPKADTMSWFARAVYADASLCLGEWTSSDADTLDAIEHASLGSTCCVSTPLQRHSNCTPFIIELLVPGSSDVSTIQALRGASSDRVKTRLLHIGYTNVCGNLFTRTRVDATAASEPTTAASATPPKQNDPKRKKKNART